MLPQGFNPNSMQFQPPTQMHAPVAGQLQLPPGSSALVTPLQPTTHQSTTTAAPSCASDWQEFVSSDGRRYYYNKVTKHSSWEKPLELMTPLERADASTVWKEFTTPEGRNYYFNKETKQSVWTIPEELKLAREKAEKEAAGGAEPELGMISNLSTTGTLDSAEQTAAAATDNVHVTTSRVLRLLTRKRTISSSTEAFAPIAPWDRVVEDVFCFCQDANERAEYVRCKKCKWWYCDMCCRPLPLRPDNDVAHDFNFQYHNFICSLCHVLPSSSSSSDYSEESS